MKIKNILPLISLVLLFSSCDDIFDPAIENFKDISQMQSEPDFAKGFLVTAYRTLPGYYDNSDVATDDAVTNSKNDNFLKIATGSWTASNNPLNRWDADYGSIQYINIFLEQVDTIHFVKDPAVNKLLIMRMRGEAYGLRGIHHYFLLRNHGGFTNDGTLSGVMILDKFVGANDDYNTPRATFKACVDQILSDFAEAEKLLPDDYGDIAKTAPIPDKYASIVTNADLYNRAMGNKARQLINGKIIKAFRSRLLLLAASPAFQDGSNTVTWAEAADAAADVIDFSNGPAGLPATGVTYYTNDTEMGQIKEGSNPSEIIWRENVATNNSDQETKNYPPSLFGEGYINPTQNLVDAFPMANGFPISDSRSEYDANNPYKNRDPRLAQYIIYNGATEGPANSVIYTGSQLGTDDGINVKETSTRTGYYMKKRLNMKVNCNPVSLSGKNHYNPRIRYTEIYLNYAEAANEAWGPKGVGSNAYSAYDVIKAVRKRAGITDLTYLDECALSKEKMRELIRNERRLELCFESFRFWDIRRWKLDMNVTATGIDWSASSFTLLNNVEERRYDDYMIYGPIPYSETLKYNNLQQNKGWK